MNYLADDREAIDVAHLERQRRWSERTFGPGLRTKGVIDHIRKELAEIEADPQDLGEWVDVVILALDGAWRAGWSPEQIIEAVKAKQLRNEQREWPDWRQASEDQAIEHVRVVTDLETGEALHYRRDPVDYSDVPLDDAAGWEADDGERWRLEHLCTAEFDIVHYGTKRRQTFYCTKLEGHEGNHIAAHESEFTSYRLEWWRDEGGGHHVT